MINKYLSTNIAISSPLRASIHRADFCPAAQSEHTDQLGLTTSDARRRLAPIDRCRAPTPFGRRPADLPSPAASTASPTATSPTEPPRPKPKPRPWLPPKPSNRAKRPCLPPALRRTERQTNSHNLSCVFTASYGTSGGQKCGSTNTVVLR